jgi:hypothetical protein
MGKTGVAMFDPRVTGGFVSGDDAVSILVSEDTVGAAGDACASAACVVPFFSMIARGRPLILTHVSDVRGKSHTPNASPRTNALVAIANDLLSRWHH